MSSSVVTALELIQKTLLLLQEEKPICFSSKVRLDSKQAVPVEPERNKATPIVQKEPQKMPPPAARSEEKKQESPEIPPLKEAQKQELPKAPAPPEFSQAPLPKKAPSSLFRPIFAKIAPHIATIDEIPKDTLAKQIATRWKTRNLAHPISVISYSESPPHKLFLSEISSALNIYFAPAQLIEAETIEAEKQWEFFLATKDLKLIVICDATLWQLHNLRKFYKEIPAQGVRKLDNIPVFLLPDLSLYLKDPKLKRSLWKTLCQQLPKS